MLNHSELYTRYRSLLLDDVIPFWFDHGIDWECGGVLSCLTDEGVLASYDKYIWSQARSVWTFSALYNRVEKRPEFLAAAENSIRFLMAHGRDDHGRWVYRTTRKGNILEGPISIYSDCFVVYGLSEYYRAVQDTRILSVALRTFERIRLRIEETDFHETAPYPLPQGWVCHGVPMIMTEVASELAHTIGDPSFESLIGTYVHRIMNHFVRTERKVLLEFLTLDYKELSPPAGTFVMPGHAIESMWFVMHVARRRGDRDLVRRAVQVLRWHLELGWDEEFGGIVLSRDVAGHTPYLPHSDHKIWWPHVEALYATLLAYDLTGEAWCEEWYERIDKWSWTYFPIGNRADWYQRLSRQGKPSSDVVALPVKDPFHLPRAAILIMQLMERRAETLAADSEA